MSNANNSNNNNIVDNIIENKVFKIKIRIK